MRLYKLIFTENNCYKAGRKMKVRGIMVHSTGANNPWLKRYVGPDDGRLGPNAHNTHWNNPTPGGREVCVHGFIGKLNDGSIATYQTLPWDHRGWHAGGSANDGYIGFEICEDGLTDSVYFEKVYREAVELCAWLCGMFGLTEKNIICHCEGRAMGIASNHADVMHWFPKHGKSMDTFRADVRALIASGADVMTGQDDAPTPPAASAYPEKLSEGYYRVRRSWEDKASQAGAYRLLSNAKKAADDNPGTYVFTDTGTRIYPSDKATAHRIHTVAKGESLWMIAARYLGSGRRYGEIMELNGLSSDVIMPGWKLKIPN